jgi:acyl-CoA synthetase (NDP forming)
MKRVSPEEILAAAASQGRLALDEASAKQLLAGLGLAVPRSAVARDAEDAGHHAARLGGRLVVKVVSPQILHKSEVGGVRVGLEGPRAVSAAVAEMAALPGIAGKHVEGWLVEEMGPLGRELVIGAYRDPQFGPMVMVGLGGILVEVLRDVAFRLCPIEAADAHAMLGGLRAAALIEGVRGARPLDREAIVSALLAIGGSDGLMMRHDSVGEVDLNPVLVGESGLMAVDARIILAPLAPPASQAAGMEPPASVLARFRPLFEPHTVAVLGASAKGGNALANTFIRRMKAFGYRGNIYPIHPTSHEIEGIAAFKSLGSTPEPVDYAFIAIGSERIPAAIAEGKGRLGFAQVISSGFSEVEGGEGLERELVTAARQAGARIIGPNCLGTYSPRGGLTFPEDAPRETGSIGLVSQSGGLTTNMIKRGQIKGLRFSGAVTAGNCADVGPAELLAYYLADPVTRAIGCYLEDVKDGRAFFELLRSTPTPKPVVILRGGRSSLGRLAAASHTGALAGDSKAWDALTRQVPAVEVATLDEFLDTLLALQELDLRPHRPTRRVVMFGNGGGTSVLGADFFAARGLEVAPFAADVRRRLEALDLLPGSSVANPIDTPVATLQQDGGRVARQILDIIYAHARPDAIALHLNMSSFVGRGGVDPVDGIFGFIGEVMAANPGVAHVLLAFRTDGDPALEERKRFYRETARRLRLPLYDEIPELARALAAVAHLERRLAATRRACGSVRFEAIS